MRSLLWCFLLSLLAGLPTPGRAQETKKKSSDAEYTPLQLELNEDGSNYLRLLTWHQFWLSSQDLADPLASRYITPSIRRSRMALLARLSSKVLLWTHVGMNNLQPQNQSPLGGSGYNTPQLFVHGAWAEIGVNEYLQIGAGLHYWNGLTRLASASTLSFMTLDQPRPFAAWHSLGVTDQFARHLGVYAKGQIGQFDYRLSINSPSWNGLAGGLDYGIKDSPMVYNGVREAGPNGRTLGTAIYQGYVRYNFWDTESTLLPFQSGTYFGKKSVLGLGAGFFLHPDGMYDRVAERHGQVRHFAVDVFLDRPVHRNNALNAYLAVQRFDFGRDYVGRWVGTGWNVYSQLGYYFGGSRLMPYAALQRGDYDGLEAPLTTLDIGLNYFIQGHHAKLTLEYHRIQGDIREAGIEYAADRLTQLRLQLQVFL